MKTNYIRNEKEIPKNGLYDLRPRRAFGDLSTNASASRSHQIAKGKKKVISPKNTSPEVSPHSIKSEPFDELLKSPPKQVVNYKPLSFWGQKVNDLEAQNEKKIKKSKDELYVWTSSDSSSTPNKVIKKKPRVRRKKKPTNFVQEFISRILQGERGGTKKIETNKILVNGKNHVKFFQSAGSEKCSTPAKNRRFRFDLPYSPISARDPSVLISSKNPSAVFKDRRDDSPKGSCNELKNVPPTASVGLAKTENCTVTSKLEGSGPIQKHSDEDDHLKIQSILLTTCEELPHSCASKADQLDSASANSPLFTTCPVEDNVVSEVDEPETLQIPEQCDLVAEIERLSESSGADTYCSQSPPVSPRISDATLPRMLSPSYVEDSVLQSDDNNGKGYNCLPEEEKPEDNNVGHVSFVTTRRGCRFKRKSRGLPVEPSSPLSTSAENEKENTLTHSYNPAQAAADERSKLMVSTGFSCDKNCTAELVRQVSLVPSTLNPSSPPLEVEASAPHLHSPAAERGPPGLKSPCARSLSPNFINCTPVRHNLRQSSPLSPPHIDLFNEEEITITEVDSLTRRSVFPVPNILSSTQFGCENTIVAEQETRDSSLQKRSYPFNQKKASLTSIRNSKVSCVSRLPSGQPQIFSFGTASATRKSRGLTSILDISDVLGDRTSILLKGGKSHIRARNVLQKLASGRLTLLNKSLLPAEVPVERGKRYESFVEEVLQLQSSKNQSVLDSMPLRNTRASTRRRNLENSVSHKPIVVIDTSSMFAPPPSARIPPVSSCKIIDTSSMFGPRKSAKTLNSILEDPSSVSTADRRKLRQSEMRFSRAVNSTLRTQTETSCIAECMRSTIIAEDSTLRVVALEDMESTHFREAYGFTNEDETISQITPRDLVLQRCEQADPVDFAQHFNENTLPNCKKIGEGVYGEVFMYDSLAGSTVFKIIPIEGDLMINDDRQKKFEEILSEIVITQELSNLREGKLHRTNGFTEVRKVWCVRGSYPEYLLDLWDEFNSKKGSENDNPVVFNDDQLFIILELAHGGISLESYVFEDAQQAASAFKQAALSFAVAEKAIQFEHRDFHVGNVLVSSTEEATISFHVDGDEFSVETNGVKVAIIDFTLSRMSYDGCAIFNDLSVDPTLFNSEGDYQFEIYRMMRAETKDKWEQFCPKTNLFWLHYTLDKMVEGVRYKKQKNRRAHSLGLGCIRSWKEQILDFTSTCDFVTTVL